MQIYVTGDDNVLVFSYDTTKSSECLCPAEAGKPAVIAAMVEALTFIAAPDTDAISRAVEFARRR